MSDAPAPDVASSTPRPKCPWTILGRLTAAVREQNGFAVALELAIVVLGVVSQGHGQSSDLAPYL